MASGPMVRSSYKAGELFIEAMMDEDEEKSHSVLQTDWQSRARLSKHATLALKAPLR